MSVNSTNPNSKHTDPTLPDLQNGTPVAFALQNGKAMTGTFSHWTKLNEGYIKSNGQAYWRKINAFQVTGEAIREEAGTVKYGEGDTQSIRSIKPTKQFNINKRFSFLAHLVKMTIKAENVSLIITGDGGLGKTKTVMDQIAIAEMVNNHDYVVVKGYSTAKGLYNTLYYNRDKMLVFDDCDEILVNDVARNILKGALDSYDVRRVHWISNKEDGEVPNEFEFTGRIIFISNMSRSRMHQALLSRSTCIDVSMTTDEKIERMTAVLANVRPDVSMEMKKECMAIMEKWKNETKDLNFRTLLKIINIRTAEGVEEEWEEMAEYMLLS